MRRCLLLLPALVACNGCTGLLWQGTDWDCKPAGNPDLQLFHAVRQNDWLVVYDEISERDEMVRPRAYFLYKNQQRVALRKRPHFVNPRTARGLPTVPVFETLEANTNFSTGLYVVAPTNTASFTIYSNQAPVASYDLPWYPDPLGRAERFALSPIMITADVVIVGAIIYFGALDSPNP